MGPKKDNDSCKVKRKMTRITMRVETETIAKHENGVHVSDLATQNNKINILKIKGADIARGATVLTKQI